MYPVSSRAARLLSLIALFVCLLASRAQAQVVTANLRGTVTLAEDGSAMPGVTVSLLHVPSGNTKTTTSNADGGYAFTGLRVGGPYRVSAEMVGFLPAISDGLTLSAGKTLEVPLAVRLPSEVIEVSGTVVGRNASGRTVISGEEINDLPSATRDPRDLIRRSPDVSVEGKDRTLTVQGQNNRFNSITIDGIRQDDDFGLNASGYPTRRSPIALSAVEELAVESSPFDVRYGKFLGGNVNIVTKSGTNTVKGQLVATYASDALVGSKSKDDEVELDFREIRYGATVGGPILKDKLHFLASVEGLAAATPVDVGPAGSGATNITSKVSQDDVANAQRIARDVYGFDAGVPARNLDEGDLKFLGKVDWAIDKRHRLSATYQRTGGNSIANTFSSDTTLALSSNWFDAKDTLHAFSARVLSDWSDGISTELEVGGKLVASRSNPLEGNGFMAATIRTADGGTILLGPDEFRHANELDNDLFHTKAQATYLLGKHLFTGGLAYEQLNVRNLFVATSNGAAEYASLEAFEARMPTSIAYANSVTLDADDAAANWNAGTATAYVQDQFRITGDLSVQGGLRFEIYRSSNNINRNFNFFERYGFFNNETLSGRSVLMPRVGVSYVPIDQLNLRAGGGLYSGGTPTVWVSNSFTNDGVGIDSAFSNDPMVVGGFDGRNIPQGLKDGIVAGNGNVDALDPDFKVPSIWKVGGGADWAFVKRGMIKFNYTFSKTRDGVFWRDLRRDLASLPNNTPVGTLPDGRPLYDNDPAGGQFNTRRGFDMLLTNTNRGYGHAASLVVEKSWPFGLFLSGSYAYQHVLEVNPANSARSVSNYGLAAVDNPENPTLAISNYEREHRLTAAIEFSRSIIGDFCPCKPWTDMKTTLGIFIETRSGQPFSWTFADAANGDTIGRMFGEEREFARRTRELFYVPRGDGSDVILNGIDPGEFDAFLRDTGLAEYRGKIAPRNAFHSPWFSKLDLRLGQDLPNPVSGHRARLVLDIENVGNLLNNRWGRFRSVPFPFTAPAVDVSYDAESQRYIYSNLRSVKSPTRVDVLASVWRMSFGLIYDF
jgi:hypothetical protein